MTSGVFCLDCGFRSNPNRVRCNQCGGKLPHSHVRENPALYAKVAQELPPAAVFDLDMTIFDNSQRFKDARRAGLVDKDGKAVAKGMMSKAQAQRKRDKFLYSKKQLYKDQVIHPAKELINDLVNEGYTIIYLTGRPKAHFEATFDQLEYFNFPLFRTREGEPLLIMKEVLGAQVAKYKANELRELSGSYKIQMYFDDDTKALQEAGKLKIPGLYDSVSDLAKHNPKTKNHRRRRDDDDDEPPTPLPRQNPMPKPKRKKMKNGKFRQENIKRYVSRLMGLPKMKKDYPDSAQRFAVAMTLVEKYYSKAKREQYYPKKNSARTNFPKEYFEDPKAYDAKRMREKADKEVEWAFERRHAADAEGDTLTAQVENINAGIALKRSQQGLTEQYIESYGSTDELEAKYHEHQREINDLKDEKNALIREQMEQENNPRANPANDKKIKKAKKLYKHMNGQEPDKIDTETVDVGDVWYKVGEGGAWQIGYMSGKETGTKEQKYIHTFNEESKDGNYPELYATMPDKGKPMLIIRGGTWKIKTDKDGIAWIYD